ncbi:hypothetical protein BCV70DRAFT_35539 [Testicularia cyperi]|uniref:Late embryogenesis abundant protein LEA-2 subgroup domain-containing protein n=1 Tax=Testicularia cyperi TaxID=1882483 RepID=A0A317XK26_9BASI|nr:hypothetical protein BCV70DRAFT_35539 [Testicularia cyperi]
MAGNTYNYSSAASAYAQPTSTYPPPTTTSSAPQHQHPGALVSPPIAGTGAYESRSTNAQGYARANDGDDDEDDEDDEDWNVYDDFNMTRPMAHRSSASGLASNQQEDYWDASKHSLVETPYSDLPGNRKSLLSSEAFGFDVRNADPRRSIIQQQQQQRGSNPNAYEGDGNRQSAAISGMGPAHADANTGIELITVPALGTEFTKDELKDMTRVSKRKKKRASRKRSWQMWVHGQDHLWGWLSPRVAVFIGFFIVVGLALMLYFVIPRVPTFAILSTTPVVAIPNGASMNVNRSPTNFSMDMGFNLRAGNRGSWISTKLHDMTMEVTDLNTYKEVGKGDLESLSLPGRTNTPFQFPVHFSYVSLNTSGDQTWQDFYQACGALTPGVTRPTLNLAIKITMKISGLIGRKQAYTQVNNIVCPFTLQSYQ